MAAGNPCARPERLDHLGGEQMSYREDHHTHDSPVHEGSDGIVGYAAIKYTAVVVIVLAILAFIAWYILPRVS
jgi:hypothetical protein